MKTRLHATTVAINGHGVAIIGASGSGKSDLALRLIDRGAALVSDDYTEFLSVDGALIASPPESISGSIEVRGLGIVTLPHTQNVPVKLIIDLDLAPERFPETHLSRDVLGISIATLALAAHEASSPIKVEWALDRVICL
jgi:HPr kinase/phosphorylase